MNVPLNLFFTIQKEHVRIQCRPDVTRRQVSRLLYKRDDADAVIAIVGAGNQHYPWYAGPLSQFDPVVGYLDGALHGLHAVLVSQLKERSLIETLYAQTRLEYPNLPPLHLVEFRADYPCSPVAFYYQKRWVSKTYMPTMAGGTSLMHMLSIPMAELARFHPLCPMCKLGFMDCGRCLGGVYTYKMVDGSTHRERHDCLNAPGEHAGTGDGFSDRTRLSTANAKSRYRPKYHFQETLTALHGTQNTAINPRVIDDVRDYGVARGWEPGHFTARQVKDCLEDLESYYKGVYDMWYQDAQLIAATINGDDGPIDGAIPTYHQKQMVEIYDSAIHAWNRAPPHIRGNRRNFLQNNFNIWVVCTVAAHRHRDARFFGYRNLVVNADGTPPRLRDDQRQHEYENIWRWIIEYNNWGEIEI
jgi:hypothetical protein